MRARPAFIAALTAMLLSATPAACAQECVRPGNWIAPQGERLLPLRWPELVDRAAKRPVVLLGELHEQAEHHRWQLQTMAAFFARRADMVLGFEMFPRRVQSVLDRWVAGELTEAEFLQQTDWANVWGFETAHYMPLFHFARMNRIPMVALNVERSLIREIGRKGLASVPEAMREGVGVPEAASPQYLRELNAVYQEHGDAKTSAAMDDPAFKRFVESQLMWDRAMAEAIRGARTAFPGRQIVAVMGRGHTGPDAVPLQLRSLGVADTMVLLPWDRAAQCSRLKSGIADAVFGIDAPRSAHAEAQRPRLGVMLESIEGAGVRIQQVVEGSVAAQAGLQAGDVFVAIAGRAVKETGDVVAAVARQAPGTWLPVRVRRAGAELEIVAKFPPLPG